MSSSKRISIGVPIALNWFAAQSEKLGAASPTLRVSLLRGIAKRVVRMGNGRE